MRIITAAIAALTLAACAQDDAPAGPEVTVFSNGSIYTGRAPGEIVEAVAVGPDGRIVFTGTEADLAEAFPNIAETVDLEGAVMYPGFTDSHAHLFGIGQRELTLDLSGTASLTELVTRIEAEAEGMAEGEMIVGRGWIETGWEEGRMPTAADLDAVVGDRIVILVRADGHALVASSAALRAAGITDETPDPDGGRIERGPDGVATGMLIDNAMGPVFALIAAPDAAGIDAAYAKGSEVYTSRGWTGVHNMSVPPAHAPVIQRLSEDGTLKLRVYNAYDEDGFEIAAGRQFETSLVTNRAVKIYMDGALGSRGALLNQPYSDRPGESGLLLREEGGTLGLMNRALEAGVQLCIHAIGDRGNMLALDWIATAFDQNDAAANARWRIEHAQVLRGYDISRFAYLGVIASMQPSHAIGDLYFAPDRVGVERLEWAYAWQDLLDANVVIAGGSDAPVEVGSPLIEFYAAVARKSLDGFQGEGWHPEQAVSRFEALQMFTSAPAYASFMEDDLGTIAVGKIADFTAFDRDLMTVPEEMILEAKVMLTVVGGKVVYRAE